MSPAAISIVQIALFGVGALALGAGVLLLLTAMGGSAGGTRIQSRLSDFWSQISATPWSRLLGCYARVWGNGIRNFVDFWFGGSDRNLVAGGLFTIIVVIGIPLAAAFNALRGGSPFLITVIVALAVSALLLAILSETGFAGGLRALLATGFFAGAFVFVPAYVLYSFTDRLIHIPVGHAAIGSVILLPLLYIPCHSLAIGGNALFRSNFGAEGGLSWLAKFIAAYAAMLPAAYLLVFFGLLFGHIAVPDAVVPLNWQTLLTGIGFTSLALAMTYLILSRPVQGIQILLYWIAAFTAVTVIAALSFRSVFGNWLSAAPGPEFWVAHAGYALLAMTLTGAVIAVSMRLFTAVVILFVATEGVGRYGVAVTGIYLLIASAVLAAAGLQLT